MHYIKSATNPYFSTTLYYLASSINITLLFRCIVLILALFNEKKALKTLTLTEKAAIQPHIPSFLAPIVQKTIPLTTIVQKISLIVDWLRAESILTSFVQKWLTSFVEKPHPLDWLRAKKNDWLRGEPPYPKNFPATLT